MFTKAIVKTMFENNKNMNFIISTNVAVGHGINGTSYTSFYGRYHWDDTDYCNKKQKHNDTRIINITDDMIVIEQNIEDERYNSGIFIHYIPYENINCISFIQESKRFGNTI